MGIEPLVYIFISVIQRFLQQVLRPLSKGLNARLEIEKKTEKECVLLLERHRRKLDEPSMECKQVSLNSVGRLCLCLI